MEKSDIQPQVSVFFLRKVYLAYLRNLPPAEIIQLWARAQIAAQNGMQLKEFLAFIWGGAGFVRWPVLAEVSDPLERHAAMRGVDPVRFFSEQVFQSIGGLVLPITDALRLADSWLAALFTRSPHELLLEKVEQVNEMTTPGTRHWIVHRVTHEKSVVTYLAFYCPSTRQPCSDMLFSNTFQLSITSVSRIQPFESVVVVSEPRSVETIIEVYGSLVDADHLRGSVEDISFDEFAHDYDSLALPDPIRGAQAKVAVRDVFTKDGKVRVLKKGCAYDAPCTLTRVAYEPSTHSRISFQRIFDAIFSKDVTTADDKLHQSVVDSIRSCYCFTFDRSSADLYLDSKRVASGIPARVIAALLREHQSRGRNEFPNSFFQADEQIVKSKLDKSLNLHLKRAMNHLQRKAPLVSLTRETGSGVVRLTVQCDISYEEQ